MESLKVGLKSITGGLGTSFDTTLRCSCDGDDS